MKQWIKQQELIKSSRRPLRDVPSSLILEPCTSPHGVYFLYENDELCYIGSSRQMFKRLKNHNITYDFAKESTLMVRDTQILERVLIKLLLPYKNCTLYQGQFEVTDPAIISFLASLDLPSGYVSPIFDHIIMNTPCRYHISLKRGVKYC